MTDFQLHDLRRRWDRGDIDYARFSEAIGDDLDLRQLIRVAAFELVGSLVEMLVTGGVAILLLRSATTARPPFQSVLFGLWVNVFGWFLWRAVSELRTAVRKSREIWEHRGREDRGA